MFKPHRRLPHSFLDLKALKKKEEGHAVVLRCPCGGFGFRISVLEFGGKGFAFGFKI